MKVVIQALLFIAKFMICGLTLLGCLFCSLLVLNSVAIALLFSIYILTLTAGSLFDYSERRPKYLTTIGTSFIVMFTVAVLLAVEWTTAWGCVKGAASASIGLFAMYFVLKNKRKSQTTFEAETKAQRLVENKKGTVRLSAVLEN